MAKVVEKTPTASTAVVEEVLGKCIDPELGIDIVSLGLIYKIEVNVKSVDITMTLTTPGCPLVPYFKTQIVDTVKTATGVDEVNIHLTFDPPWSPDKMSVSAKQMLTMMRG